MNKRQHKKIMCNLVAKIAAKATYPELKLHSTRPERKVFRNEEPKVAYLVSQTLLEATQQLKQGRE